ncbi:MAG: oligosaccharide flippase family protein [Acidimicrobiales bacterium]
MARRRWLVRRVGTLAGGRVAAAAVSAGWLVVAARRMSLDTYGDLLLLLGLGLLLYVVNDFGLPLALTDAVAREPAVARTAFLAVLGRRMVLGVLSAALVVVAYLAASARPDLVAAGIFCVSVVSTAVYSTAAAVFRGFGRVRVEAVNEIVSRVFVIAAGSAWLASGGGLRAAVGVYAAADAMSAAVLTAVAWRATRGAVGSVDTRRFALGRMAPVAVATGLGVLYYRVDLWLLALLRGPHDVALYGSAYRVLDGLLLAASAVAALSIRAVARAGAGEQRRVVGRLVRLSLLVTVPLAAVGLVGAHPVMRVLFGARYGQAAGLLRLLLVAAVPSAVVTVVAPLAFLRGRTAAVRGFTVMLAADVGLNLVLIPAMGPAGAALATLGCQVVLAGWLWRSVLRWPAGPDDLEVGGVAGRVPVPVVPAAAG